MSFNPVISDYRCNLLKLERTNMVTKMEDRIKVDLAVTSRQILDHLGQCNKDSLAHSAETINRIAVLFNQGALTQYHYGEIEKAEALCRGEIDLLAELSSCSEHKALCLANMVPPYINLARIYGQKGRIAESLDIFEEVYRFGMQQKDLVILGHRLSAVEAPSIFAAEPAYKKVMLSCRVIDSARVLQTAEDYSALLQLVTMNQSLSEYEDRFFQQYFDEVRCRTLLAMGQYEMTMEAFTECLKRIPTNSVDRVTIHSLLSQIYREWGRYDLANKTLHQLEGHLAALEKLNLQSPALRQVEFRIALERYLMGDVLGALAAAKKAFQWSGKWNDQSGSIRCAILLLRIYGDPTSEAYSAAGQQHWSCELQRLASSTFFKLDRACAYWELGLYGGPTGLKHGNSACKFLQDSYHLFCSVPFLDSMQSGKTVKRLLDSLGHAISPSSTTYTADSSPIDMAFEALLEYVPKSFTASPLPLAI
jgi:tetratricopeptide (TPR) repeat protein